MKKIELIIKQTLFDGFYVMMRGHYPNPEFGSIVSDRLSTYEEAWKLTACLDRAVSLLGNDVRRFNDRYAEAAGITFCDRMAFERLETVKTLPIVEYR